MVEVSKMLSLYNLPADTKYKLVFVDPITLLNPKRLDIVAKYAYLDLKDKCPEYAKSLYLDHIRAMTKGSYYEPFSDKSNKEKFITSFDFVYDNIKDNGYSSDNGPIPADKNMCILDGAHRIAACIKLGIKVPVAIYPIDAVNDVYDQSFFENQGISPDFLDEIIKYYIKLHPQTVCINIWPSAKGHDRELDIIIKREFNVIYKKQVTFNENAAFYYLAQIYKEYSWAQNSEEGFSGVYRKLMPCFPVFDPVRVVFAEIDDYSKLIKVKDEMRGLFALDKHSLHITDNKEETIEMADILLSENTISFLNKCEALKYKSTFKLLDDAKKIQEKSTVCFTGSVVLALYGIREANDIDFISEREEDKDSHNYLLPFYQLNKFQAIFQPDLHFSFFGLHFLTLDCVKNFKRNRNEGKDADDIKLIGYIESSNNKHLKAELIRRKRRLIAKTQGYIIRAAHKTGTYEFLRKMYSIMKYN